MEPSRSVDPDLDARLRREELVADLARLALEAEGLDRPFAETVEGVAETLDCECCGVLESLPDGRVLLRAGVGWLSGDVGSRLDVDERSPTGETLETGEPIAVEEFDPDERCDPAGPLADRGAESAVAVPIGSADDPWGVLAAGADEPRAFAEADVDFLGRVAAVLESAVENGGDGKDGAADRDPVGNELREIYGRISDGFFALDEEWRFTYVNDRAHELINPEGRTLVGERVWEEFPQATDRAFEEQYERAMYEQETVSFEEYYPEPLDAWFEVRAYPSESGLSVYFRDVTERKEHERQLAESERRYRTLVEHFPNGIVTLFDEAFRYTLAAGQAFEYLPVDEDDVEDRTPREVWGDDVADALEPLLRAALDGEAGAVELAYEGREWVVHAVPVTDEDGEVFAGMTMAQDITERKEYERRLAESERRYRTLSEHFPDGAVGVYDEDLRYTLAEGVMLGDRLPNADRLEGDRMPDLFPESTVADLEPVFRAAVEDGETASTTTEFGGRYWRVWATPLRDDGGEITAGLSFAQDVTERVEREKRLQRYETIVEAVNDGVYVVDADGYFTMVNETYAEMLDYPREELVGMHVSEVVDDEVMAEASELQAAMETGRTERPSIEAELRTATGERRPAEATFALLPESDDAWYRVGVVRDISERKERERRLAESERRYRTLVENFPEGAVALFDADLEYTVVGGQLLEDVGVAPEERVGNSVYEIYPDDLVDEVEPYFEAALDGEASSFEVEFHDRHLYAHTLPVRDADDDIFAGMLVIQDVTERREYRRRLEESNERLEQFAYAASHDLQEPLRMVSSYLRLIERRYADALDPEGEEFIEYAVDGADRMRRMIEGLLAYSRVETRGDPFEPVDLGAVLADAREDLQFRIDETDTEITVEELPRVAGDADQLRQVFQNLLENAIEYSGDDPPRIRVSAAREGDRWEVAVADEGVGVAPEDQERIFEVFQRLHGREETTGTGIGLALCERIVERHGGEITVDSAPGEGTTVRFTLPTVERLED